MEQELLALGLTWNEVKVYKSLMKLGETQVGGVITDLKIHRQIAYNALDALEKRGMVTKTSKNKVQHYKIVDPEVIVENVKKQEVLAERLARTIKHEMKKSRHEHEISLYNGREAARRFFIQSFKKFPVSATTYIMGVPVNDYTEAMGADFLAGPYNKIRNQRDIRSRLLVSERMREENKEYEKLVNPVLRETRYLPYQVLNPISTLIWDDHISFISLKPEFFIIDILSQAFRDSYKEHFDMLWKMAKK